MNDSPYSLALCAILVALGVLWLPLLAMALRSWRFLRRPRPPLSDYTPAVALIAPCRGVDQGFEDNVRAVLAQDYPNYRVLFVTGTTEDPAYPVLARIVAEYPHARLLVAGQATDRGQKVHNLLAAIEATDDAEVLAFVDSDGRPHRTWLRSLVAPLADPAVGASSGFFWYRPEHGGVWSWARAYSANITALTMAHDDNSGLWGGGMAVRREVFDRAGVAEAWQHAICDDVAMAHRIDRLGLKIAFVPECFTEVVEDCDFAGLWEYLFRHFVMARAYEGRLWLLLGLALALPALAVVGGGSLLLAAPFSGAIPLGALLLLQWPLQVAYGAAVPALVFGDRQMARAAPLLLVVEPVGHAAYLASALTRKLTWRGITYELISAEETRVLPPEEAVQPWEASRLAQAAASVRALPVRARHLAEVVLGGGS